MRFPRFALGLALTGALACPAVARASVNSWQLVGPIYTSTPNGTQLTGAVTDIDAHNHRVLTQYGGLWRFSFGAVPMSDSIPASRFDAFASPLADANTILVGTDAGLFRSADGGATWTHISLPGANPSHFYGIRWSPDGSTVHCATDLGYFRSTDAGYTWTAKVSGKVTDVSVTSGQPNTVFASVIASGSSLYRSNDGGQTWAQVAGVPVAPITDVGTVSAVYVGGTLTITTVIGRKLWRSNDGGGTWQNLYTLNQSSGPDPHVTLCPADPNLVLWGAYFLLRSTDGGNTFTQFNPTTLHNTYRVFAWEDDATNVWAGSNGGWFHSADRGLNWDSGTNVMPAEVITALDCERTELGYMIAGTSENNVIYTPTEALFWNSPDIAGSATEWGNGGLAVAVDQYNPSQMWGYFAGQGTLNIAPVFRTQDGGTNWSITSTGLPVNGASPFLCTDNAFPVNLFYAVGGDVYTSTDAGGTWIKLTANPFPYTVGHLTSSQRVSGGAVLYASLGSSPGQRLYVRDNGTWYERSGGLPVGTVGLVVPHPWAAFANEAWAVVNGHTLFHTGDRGVTWTSVTGDLPTNLSITGIVPNPHNSNELYVGCYGGGLWRTLNNGVNWEQWNSGLPPYVQISAMTYIDRTGSGGPFEIVAGTYGRSVFKRDIAGSDPQPSVTVSDASCAEGNSGTTTMTFTLTLSAKQLHTVYVDYATVDGSAVAGSDYLTTSGTATFGVGQNTVNVTVTVNGDTQIEPDETFSLVLSNPIRCTIANSGTGTIYDDDASALVNQGMPVTDGTVNALAVSGDTLFVGGAFGSIGAATGSGVPIDSVTAQPVWIPKVTGSMTSVVSDGAGGWFIGGNFTHVGGQPRQNLAHLLANHTVDAWNPSPNGIVFTLAMKDSTLYVGGGFSQISGVTRSNIAAMNARTGAPLVWDPNADAIVTSLAVGTGTVYAGGDFSNIGGQLRRRIAALNTSGAATSWNPGASDEVDAMVVQGSLLYVGGAFDSLGGQVRHHIGAIDVGGSASAWNPNADGYVSSLAVNGATVYVGGPYLNIGGQARSGLAALDATTGLATSWAPNPDAPGQALALDGATLYVGGSFTTMAGQPRNRAAAFDLAGNLSSWAPEPNGAVVTVAARGGQVFVGGSVSSIAPLKRSNLAAVSISTGAVLGWNPGSDNVVNCLALNGPTLYVGGNFTTIGGQSRTRAAALDMTTGIPNAFNPNANARVFSLLPIGSIVVAGGQFTSIGGQTRNRIAALSASSGAATTWNPNANNIVASVATDGTVIYAGGAFTSIGGQARNGLAALSGSTGAATTWNPAPNGTVSTLTWFSSALWVGGNFTTIGGLGRARAAIVTTTAVSSWNGGANNNVNCIAPATSGDVYLGGLFTAAGGATRHYLAGVRISNSSASSFAPEPNGTVNAILTVGSTVWVGGSFSAIGGLPQQHLAMLITPSQVAVPAPTAGAAADLNLALAPNPTRGEERISYTLPAAARVKIGIYDVLGRRVSPVIDRLEAPGTHTFTWAGARGGAAPGIYFVRLEAAGRQVTRRVAIVQ